MIQKFWLSFFTTAFSLLMLSACAGWKVEERLSSLEAHTAGQRVLDLRLSRVEETLAVIENKIEKYEKTPGGSEGKKGRQATGSAASLKRSDRSTRTVQIPPPASAVSPPASTVSLPASAGQLTEGAGKTPSTLDQALHDLANQSHAEPYSFSAAALRPVPVPGRSVGRDRSVVPSFPGSDRQGKKLSSGPAASGKASESFPSKQAVSGKSSLAQYKTGQQGYDDALQAYESGNYRRAMTMLNDFAQKNPASSLVPNTVYWRGECLYALKEYPQAVHSFKELISKYPRHTKTADALLKIGLAYSRMHDQENARFHWKILLEDFPKSRSAQRAKTYLQSKL